MHGVWGPVACGQPVLTELVNSVPRQCGLSSGIALAVNSVPASPISRSEQLVSIR